MAEENLLVILPYAVAFLIFTATLVSYRVLFGPTLADRAVALNTATTKAVVIIAMLALLYDAPYLLDISIVLLMVNAVGGLIIAKYMEVRS
ncbi:MAG: cation:proton antiporter [Thermococcus sp.]|uniref:Cation:proton antiporter n=1 Tax=Thermococcus guaymasensis DSM 11113 TaxID=1432656 RepID=A0A0X1KHS9_9EURY|nr:monovalent cation/H+ antiporter complex subunit F [Thermococcus guaymasensis]AJC70817.1 cation:proton antiporter [Thermococcus guaymasensis DSM 11113]MCD6524608.1 cation:proton antiporter [Thermococcus sp.]